MRKLLFLALSSNIILGVLVAIFLAPFYGDALNFYKYAEEFAQGGDLFFYDDIKSYQNINVLFVSYVYKNSTISSLVNLGAVLIFVKIHSLEIKKRGEIYPRNDSAWHTNNSHKMLCLVLLCPALIARFGEPSREFMQSLLLFTCGMYLYRSRTNFLICLSMASLIRPIALPLYLLWLFFCEIYRRNVYLSIIYIFLIFILTKNYSSQIELIGFYNEKIIDYEGVLGEQPTLPLKIILNIFGDVNSFFSAQYPLAERIIFLFDYIWRIIVLVALLKIRNIGIVLLIFFASLLISLFYPFPHPRYFIPVLFFLLGLASNSRSKFFN